MNISLQKKFKDRDLFYSSVVLKSKKNVYMMSLITEILHFLKNKINQLFIKNHDVDAASARFCKIM